MAAIALTDHDTIGGVAAAIAEGQRCGIEVIAGCEFSVKVAWGEMHLLGYFLPLDNPEINGFLERERAMRLNRARKMVESLQAWGVDIDDQDVMAEAGNAAVGRPHVARALVRLGKVADVPAAFDEFLGQGSHSAELQAQIEEIARQLGLVRTGGTDWHGPGHDDVLLPIGACGVPMEWLEAMRRAQPGP
jgi:predicted metal-dependent phosphoesterase TrpH